LQPLFFGNSKIKNRNFTKIQNLNLLPPKIYD
jgi:hypothetical protein